MALEKKMVSVEAVKLSQGYRYIGTYEDGTKEVIRKKATRLYANAFFYNGAIVCSGPKGIAKYFTFGQKPLNRFFLCEENSKVMDRGVTTFKIEAI